MALLDKIGHARLAALAATAVAMACLALAIPAPVSAQDDPAATDTATPAFTLRGYLRDRDRDFARIDPPGSVATKPGAINHRGQIVGTADPYLDRPNDGFGYLRDRNGRYRVIDPPGDEIRTAPAGINDHGDIAGFCVDGDGTSYQGFLRDRRGRYTVIDHPDATGTGPGGDRGTVIWAINQHGTVSGNYVDASGIGHCFLRNRWGRLTTIDHPRAAANAPPPTGSTTAAKPSAPTPAPPTPPRHRTHHPLAWHPWARPRLKTPPGDRHPGRTTGTDRRRARARRRRHRGCRPAHGGTAGRRTRSGR